MAQYKQPYQELYPHLFNPLKVGKKTLKNRIITAPTTILLLSERIIFSMKQVLPTMVIKPEVVRRRLLSVKLSWTN